MGILGKAGEGMTPPSQFPLHPPAPQTEAPQSRAGPHRPTFSPVVFTLACCRGEMHKQNEWPVPPGGRATQGMRRQGPLMTSHVPCSLAIPSEEGWRGLGTGGGSWDSQIRASSRRSDLHGVQEETGLPWWLRW